MKRMHRILSSFSRGSKNARLNQLMFRNVKTVETNANGTSGYVVKSGKNSGKILGHIKKRQKIFKFIGVWGTWQHKRPSQIIN